MPEKQTDNPSDWFLRRHSYGPNFRGMTEPDEPIPSVIDPGIIQRVDRTNELLEELLNIQYHNNIIEHDIDISDSVAYDLSASEAAEVTYKVPSNYVMLLRKFYSTLNDNTTYYVYLNDEMFQYVPDMEFPGMGLAVSPQITFKMYVLNTSGSSQSYTSLIEASLRRSAYWTYPAYSYKMPV